MNLTDWINVTLIMMIVINIVFDVKYLKIYGRFIKELDEFEKEYNYGEN